MKIVIKGFTHMEDDSIPHPLPLTEFEVQIPQDGKPLLTVDGEQRDIDADLTGQLITLLSQKLQ